MENGLYPYTKRYLGSFDNHFSTIGLIGMNEACLNACWIKQNLTNREAIEFTKNVLNHMRERLVIYQEEYGNLYNLEATPAESTTYRLAKFDKKVYPDIITAGGGENAPYYTNSSHLPVGYTEDIFTALDIQDELQTLYTSGTVFHAFLGQEMPDWKSTANLVRKIAENYTLPYYTLSPTYSVCATHGYLTGKQEECPYCHRKTEVYSRITGYYRPVQNWNEGKISEFSDRKVYDIQHSEYHAKAGSTAAVTEREECGLTIDAPTLFTRRTCPNCKAAKMLFDKVGFEARIIDAEEEADMSRAFGVRSAPTLVIPTADGFERIENLSNIKKYIESLK